MLLSPPFIWAVLGILLIGAEFIVPGFVIFFFGLGALLTSAATLIIPPLREALGFQALLWASLSLLSFALLRKRFSRIFKGTFGNKMEEEAVGKPAEVIEEISPENPGRIKYQGTSWKAVSYTETFKPGDRVRIIEKENLTFTVTGDFLPFEEK